MAWYDDPNFVNSSPLAPLPTVGITPALPAAPRALNPEPAKPVSDPFADLDAAMTRLAYPEETDTTPSGLAGIPENTAPVVTLEGLNQRIANKPEAPWVFGWDTLSAAKDYISNIPTFAKSAFYRLTEDDARPDQYSPGAKVVFEEEARAQQQVEEERLRRERAGESTQLGSAIREAIPSSGFSLGSMGAAAAAGIPAAGLGTLAAGPVGGIVGGISGSMAGSGAAAYRMQRSTFLEDSFKAAEDKSLKENGRSLNEPEKQQLYNELLPLANDSALWEAGPEAIGNAATLVGGGIALKLLGKGALSQIAGGAMKKAAIRAGAATAGVATELGTETATQKGQALADARRDAVLEGKPIDEAVSRYDMPGGGGTLQAFKDIAAPTLGTLVMFGLAGGAVKGGTKAYERIVTNPREAEEIVKLSNDPNIVAALPDSSLKNLSRMSEWLGNQWFQGPERKQLLDNALIKLNAEIANRESESGEIKAERKKTLQSLWDTMGPQEQLGVLGFLQNESAPMTGWVDKEGEALTDKQGRALGEIDVRGLAKLAPVLGLSGDVLQKNFEKVRGDWYARQEANQQQPSLLVDDYGREIDPKLVGATVPITSTSPSKQQQKQQTPLANLADAVPPTSLVPLPIETLTEKQKKDHVKNIAKISSTKATPEERASAASFLNQFSVVGSRPMDIAFGAKQKSTGVDSTAAPPIAPIEPNIADPNAVGKSMLDEALARQQAEKAKQATQTPPVVEPTDSTTQGATPNAETTPIGNGPAIQEPGIQVGEIGSQQPGSLGGFDRAGEVGQGQVSEVSSQGPEVVNKIPPAPTVNVGGNTVPTVTSGSQAIIQAISDEAAKGTGNSSTSQLSNPSLPSVPSSVSAPETPVVSPNTNVELPTVQPVVAPVSQNSSNIPSSEAGILPESSTKTQPTKIVQAPPAPAAQVQSQPVEYKNRKLKLATARTDISDEFNTNAWANVALANMNAGDRIKAGNKQGTVKSITENRIVITWQEGNKSNNKIYTVYSKDWESLVRDLGNSLGQSAMDRLSPIRLKTISGKQEEDPSGQAFDALLRDPAFRYDPQERSYRLSDSFANKPQPKKESADVVRNQEGQAETPSLLDGKKPVTNLHSFWETSDKGQREEWLRASAVSEDRVSRLANMEFADFSPGLRSRMSKSIKNLKSQQSTAVKEEGNAAIQGPQQDDNQPKHQGTGGRLGTGQENREQPTEEQGSSSQTGRSNQSEQGGEKQAVTPEKKKQTVVTPNGNKIDTEFEVVELDDLITSDRPEFPSELQPRNRSRVASETQVDKIASKLDPEQLAESRLASDGAPVIGTDHVVESGNGRVMAVRRVYSQSRLADKAAEYRKMIESRGFDTTGMKQPVLVRRRTTNLSTDERKSFTVDANTQNIAGLSPSERAIIHAGRLTTAILDLYQGGDLFSVKNSDFVRAFLDRVALNESSEMTTKDGLLNKEGVNRITNAIIAKAYNNIDFVDSLLESQDDNIKSLGGALLDVAPGMVKLKSKIESNLAPKDLDITSALVEAAQLVSRVRREGKFLKDLLNNESMFGDGPSPLAERIVKLFFSDEFLRRQISREKIVYLLNSYLGYANEVKMSDPLFADVPSVTVNDIVKSLEDKKREGNKPVSTGSLFSRNAPSASGTANREEVQGPGDVAQGKESGTTELGESKGNGEQQQGEGQKQEVAPVEPKKQEDKVAPAKQEKEPIISEKEQEPKESSPPTEASKKESNYGKSNTVFTEDAAAKARALLKKKLGQLNSGLDPELVQAGITLAGYHVEAGARGFAAYAKAMLDDLGDTVRPFLRSWYEALRYYPGFNSKDMTPLSEMDQVEKNLDTIFNKGQAKQQEQPKETTETQVSYDTTVDKIISDNGILIQTGNRAWSTSGTAPTVFVDVPRGSNLIVNSNDVEAFTKPHHFDKDTGFYYVNFQGNRVFAAGPFRNPSVRFIDHVYKSYLGETTNTTEMKKRIKAMAKKMVDDVEYRKQVITEGLAYAIADSKKLTIERGPAFTSGTTTRPVRARSETVLERLRDKIRGLTRSANYISKRVAAERQLTEDNRRPVSRGTVNLISRGLAKGMPQQVIDWQIDDIAKALTNYRDGKPAFMLSADPGSGKTFTLGGFMREVLAEDPKARILYFTNSNTLIDQIRNQDLPDYGVNDGRVDIITYSRIQNPQNATITHSDGKSLIEIGDNQILVDDNTILVFDEAHKVKNILDSGEGARNASELMQRAKFTLYSSATPFETVDEAEYLANSGMFEEYDELAESEDLSYKDIRLTGFQVWAIEHGADLSFQKGKDGSVDQISIRWPNAPRFSLPANVGNTEKIAAIREFEAAQLEFMVNQFESGREARQWFIQRNLLTHRPISLGTLKSGEQASVTHLTPVAGSKDFYDNYYNVVVGIYDTALADDSEEAQKLRPTILMQRENIKKRMAEIAKLEETANLVKKDLSSNPDRKALVFVKVKAPLEFGKFKVWDDVEDATSEKRILKKIDRLIAGKDNTTLDKISNDKYQGNKERSISALKSLKDQLKDRRFDSNEISLLESEWSDYLGAMVEVTKSQNGVTWTEIENQGMFSGYSRFMAKAFMDAGLSDLRLDSPVQILENLLAKDFGNDSIVGYNGSLSEVKNVKNREAWKQERSGPRIMIATMDKGGTGLSLQDTTGNRPTFQYNVAIPYTATEFEQVSGRIARYGLQSQANVYWLFANDMPDQFDFRWAKILQERLYNQQGLVKGDVSDTAQNLNAENVLGENKEGNQYSIGDNQEAKAPLTVEQARAEVATLIGENQLAAMERLGKITFHAVNPTNQPNAQAFVDEKGNIHFVVENIQGNFAGIALHEDLHLLKDKGISESQRKIIRLSHAVLALSGLKNFVGNASYDELVKQAHRMAEEGNPHAVKALAKAKEVSPSSPDSEFVNYLVEYAPAHIPFVRRVMSKIRAVLYRMGIKVELRPEDLRELALSAFKQRANQAAKAQEEQAKRIKKIDKQAARFEEKYGPAALQDKRVEVLRSLEDDTTQEEYSKKVLDALKFSIAPSELPIETAKILGEDSSWNLNPDLQGRVVAALRNPLQAIKVGVEKSRPVWLGLLDRQMLVEMIENLPGVGPIAIQFQKTARKLDAMKQELKQKMYPVAEALAEQIARSRDKGYKFSRLLYGSTLHQVDPLGLPPDPDFVGASYDEKQRFAEKEKWYKIVKGWADELERENPALFKLYKEMRANYDYMLNERFNALMARLGRSSEDVVTSLLDHAKSKAEKNIDPMVQQLSQLQRDNDKTYRRLKASLMAVMPQLYPPKKVTIHNYLNPPKAPAPQPVSVIRSKLDASARPLFDAMMERLENATTDGDLQRKIFFGLMAKAEYLTREQGKPGSLSLSGKLASLYKANPKEFDALQTALSAYLSKPNSVIKYEMVPSKRNPNVTIRTISVVDLQNDPLSVEARANLSEEAQKLFVEAARNSQDQIKESAGAIKYFYETAMAQGPYANLMRYGKYEIYAEKEGEKLPIFAKFEDPRDQKRAALALQAEGWTVNSGYQIENRVFEQAPTGSFVGNLIGLVDDVVKNEQEKATLKDDINQLYLASLPDMSASKHFMHRKGIPGFSQDALRGYAQFMNQSANAIARLNFSDIMIRNLRDLKKANDALGVPYDEESSKMQAMAGSVINELNDSYEWQMNPTNSTLANRITGLGFFWYLTNFSTALINMSQVPLMTFPDLAARYGAKNATSEIMKAVKEYGKWKFNWGEGKKKAEEAIDARFDGDMGRMLQFLEKTGAKSRTETVSLAGMGEEDAYFSSNPVVMWANKFAKALSFPFQQSEIANREISAIAAYTLARQAANDKTPEDAHQYAQEIAYNTVFRTQNDFSNANRARYWRSDLARILLLFKSYAKLMTWRQLRDAHQAFKEIPSNLTGEDKARFEKEKQIAKHRLAYMGAASLVFGGAMGFPLYTIFITIANAFFGNDPDDPYDVETEVNQALQSMAMSLTNNEQSADLIRQTIMKGPVGALMGSDLSPRLSLDLARLWFRKIPEQKTGDQWGLAALQQAAGPVFGGMFIGAAKGTHDIIQGINQGNTSDVSRGVEGILPAPARNAIKTWRYLTQGVETRRGDKIVDDLSAYEAAMQAIGFAPARVADQYDRNAAMMEVKGWLDTRRKNLINGYVYAVENQDYKKANEFMKDITEFNVKNPSLWIKQDSLIKAMKNRERVRANSNGGLYIPSKGMRARLEEERY